MRRGISWAFSSVLVAASVLVAVLVLGVVPGTAVSKEATGTAPPARTAQPQAGYTLEQIQDLPLQEKSKAKLEGMKAAAARSAAQGMKTGAASTLLQAPGPGDTPDYFGPWPNYALSPLPELIPAPPTPPTPPIVVTTFYFAEGTTRPGFDPYICIQNPGTKDAKVTVTYMKGDGTTATEKLTVVKNSRSTIQPRMTLGTGDDAAHDFSAKVECTNNQNIVAERPMYFNYKPGEDNWNGGHDVVGATSPASTFYFAEGTTRPGFDTYICIQNPGLQDADVKLTYMKGDGTTATEQMTVAKNSRSTIQPWMKLGVGDDAAHDFSTKVQCTNGQKIVAERPMYFNYKPGEDNWNGGHDVVGGVAAASSFYFAEGTTRPGFDPYICIQNPGSKVANITITYMKGNGTITTELLTVNKNSRSTIQPRITLGTGDDAAHDFSAKVECTNGRKIVAERPMYFNYKPGEDNWNDGSCVVGATVTDSTFYFAEGTTRPSFDPYISIQNPGTKDAKVTVTYMKGDGTSATEKLTVIKNSRSTVQPRMTLGTGDDAAHDFSAKVACTNGQKIIAERPMYFNYKPGEDNWNGGHDVVGFSFQADAANAAAVAAAAYIAKPGTGMRKFVDTLPGLGAANANDLGQYVPVAVPDTTTYPGCDYYEIEVGRYTEKMHKDLPATQLTGYRQTNTSDPTVSRFHYLGPTIVAHKDKAVRVKFTNSLPTGAGGDLFVPCDTTLPGAGAGPIPGEDYTQNRAVIHLHGGNTPWISDGTPHQWIVPAGETTSYKEGVSTRNVPDMWFLDGAVIPDTEGQTTPPVPGATNDPGEGSATYYFTNQQSGRLLFYHDHALAITRLNVYTGMAAPYIIRDTVEQNLISTGTIPSDEIPLVIQDKTFVPGDSQLTAQDPTWDKTKWGGLGNLWLPHVYMPNQNPASPDGFNTMARWHYGPWFHPPTTTLVKGPQPNPYYDPVNAPWENSEIPGTPTPSMVMESFLDTPTVNGTAYPVLQVEPKSYRFRILGVANDRGFNLSLYQAKSQGTMWHTDGTLNNGDAGEVKMVPATATPGWPDYWPTDGRAGGVPDPATRGPSMIQIGNEGGFLPSPTVLTNRPITWVTDPTLFRFGNVESGNLMLGPAERADVIVDFSQYAGKTLVLYNDGPAPWPAPDHRYDYYTGAPDLSDVGGSPGTQPGYGPNTRTIMQIKVAAGPKKPAFNMAKLQSAFASTATTEGAFVASQDDVIIPNAEYNSAYNRSFPADTYSRIYQNIDKTFTTLNGDVLTLPVQPKAIQDEMGEAFDKDFGRMSGMLGLEVVPTGAGNQNFMLYPFMGPVVDVVGSSSPQGAAPVAGDGTQVWMITHNGVDTHTIHFHKYDVQVINRVGWDGQIVPPDANELGWKESLRVNPLENTVIALRPVYPTVPFPLPDSVRLMDPTQAEGAILGPPPPALANWVDPTGNITAGPAGAGVLTNEYVNFASEFVLHCHLLSHEEMDMMHAQVFTTMPAPATNVVATGTSPSVGLTWTDNATNETSYVIEWADNPDGPWTVLIDGLPADTVSYTDVTTWTGNRYYRVIARNPAGTVGPDFVRPVAPNFPTGDSTPALSNLVTTP